MGWATALPMREAGAFAALISAIDPVATLATFGSLKVDQTLNTIVFGESVLGLYKIFVYFEAVVHESTTLSFLPATCIADPCCNTVARLLDSIRPFFRPPVCMLYTIQYW